MPGIAPVIKDIALASRPSASRTLRAAPPLEPVTAAQVATVSTGPAPKPDLRFFFFADAHAGYALTDKFVRIANAERPDLLVDGGDIVEDGSQAEFDRAWAERAKLLPALRVVTGNHDVLRRGQFTHDPPVLPDFQSFDHQGVHFVLLDDGNARMSEDLFKKLEADLEANEGKTTILAMHVPPVVSRLHGYVKLKDLIPFNTASVGMKDPAQVERFKALMKKHRVAAVLAGHTHAPSAKTIDGTQYVIAGATGGKTPGPGIAHEYLDIAVYGRDVHIRRVPLDKPPGNVVSHAVWTGNYIAQKNAYNHAVLGWDHFIPTTSSELRFGARHTVKDGQVSDAATMTGQIETSQHPQGKNAYFVEGTVGIGSKEATADVGLGYKRRLIGNYNKNLNVSVAGVANGGVIGHSLTAGVGARVGVGYENKNWTFQLSAEKATNRTATMFSIGHRF